MTQKEALKILTKVAKALLLAEYEPDAYTSVMLQVKKADLQAALELTETNLATDEAVEYLIDLLNLRHPLERK